MEAIRNGANEFPTEYVTAATASAQAFFSDGGSQSQYSPGAVSRSMPLMRKLRQAGHNSDVTFRTTDGGEILAYRFVLADWYVGCCALLSTICEALDTSVDAEQGEQFNHVQCPPISEVIVHGMSSAMLQLVVDFAYHHPLHEHVCAHNVVEILEWAEANNISALQDRLRLRGKHLEPGNCVGIYQVAVRKGYLPLNSQAFSFIVRNSQKRWTTSHQFQSLTFGKLWNVLHDDELHVTSEVECRFRVILKWIAGNDVVRRRLLFGRLPLVRFASYLSSCERYDASSNQWEFVAPIHEIGSNASAVAAVGRVYTMGGFNGLDVHNTVEYYNPSSDAWTRVVSMSSPRIGFKAVMDGDDFYLVGGFDGDHRVGSAERLDVRNCRRSELPIMAFPRRNFVAALLEGSIYLRGGFDGATTVSLVERYDIDARQWHRAGDISIPCSGAAAFVYHNVPNAKRSV